MNHPHSAAIAKAKTKASFNSKILAIALSALISVLITGCSSPPREEQLRSTIELMETQLEENQVSDFLDNISPEFRFNQREDKAWIKRILTIIKLRKSNVEIVTTKTHVDISPNEEEADATINGYVASFQGMGIDQGRQFSLETSWYYEGGEWLLYSVNWKNPPSFAGF